MSKSHCSKIVPIDPVGIDLTMDEQVTETNINRMKGIRSEIGLIADDDPLNKEVERFLRDLKVNEESVITIEDAIAIESNDDFFNDIELTTDVTIESTGLGEIEYVQNSSWAGFGSPFYAPNVMLRSTDILMGEVESSKDTSVDGFEVTYQEISHTHHSPCRENSFGVKK